MKKKNYSVVLLSLFIGLLILSNNNLYSTDPPAQESADVIMPLAIGNYWKMKTYYYKTSNPDSIFNLELTETKIISSFEKDGITWYKTSDNRYLSNHTDGLWCYISEDGDVHLDSAKMIAKYPTFVDDKWLNIQDNTTVKTVDLNKMVYTQVGVLKCVHYQIISPETDIPGELYVNPKIGVVSMKLHDKMQSALSRTDTVFYKTELIEYSIGK